MNKTKIIFLDCDGVINYTDWYSSPKRHMYEDEDIDPDTINRIINVCKSTNAKIVISSDWRISWYDCLSRLSKAGLGKYIIDRTPDIYYLVNRFPEREDLTNIQRGEEIDEWISNHPNIYNYVIIDDRMDFTDEQLRHHFIHINPKYGFTDEDMKRVIDILNF